MNTLQSNITPAPTPQYTSAGISAEGITETPQQTQTTSPIPQQVTACQTRKRWGLTDSFTLFLRLLFGFIAFNCFHNTLHETFSKLFGSEIIEIVLEVCMAVGVGLSAKETAAKSARWLVANLDSILTSVLGIAMFVGGVRWVEQKTLQLVLPPSLVSLDWLIDLMGIILVLVVSIYSARGLVRLLREHVFERQPRR